MNARVAKFESLVVFIAVSLCAAECYAMDARDVFKQMSPSVVLIKTYDEASTPLKLGSGFFVDDGHKIVTNFHVVDGAARVEIVFSDKSSAETQDLIGYSQEHDLAILQIATSGKPIALSTRKPDVGDHILAIGNPIGLQRTLSEGLISGVREIGGGTVYQMTAPISPGSSGGPIIDDQGTAIGVTSFTVLESQNVNFAIPSANVLELLKNPSPVSLNKLPRARGSSELVFGRGGLEVVKFTKSGNVVGISIKNTTDSAIGAVLVRVLYSEQSADIRRISKWERDVVTEKNIIAREENERTAVQSALKRLASINFLSLTAEDEAFLNQLSSALAWDAKYYRQYKQEASRWKERGPGSVHQINEDMAEDHWRSLTTELVSVRDSLKQDLKATDDIEQHRQKLSQLQDALAGVRSSARVKEMTMVHYEDKALGPIAPRMTRYFEFNGEGKSEWQAKAVILDHVVQGAEHDRLITTTSGSKPD